MPKFELYPYILTETVKIGEIRVSIELTDEEVLYAQKLDKKEFKKYIVSRMNVEITDFSLDFDAETIDSWDECDD